LTWNSRHIVPDSRLSGLVQGEKRHEGLPISDMDAPNRVGVLVRPVSALRKVRGVQQSSRRAREATQEVQWDIPAPRPCGIPGSSSSQGEPSRKGPKGGLGAVDAVQEDPQKDKLGPG
jgi:hypothetical protein